MEGCLLLHEWILRLILLVVCSTQAGRKEDICTAFSLCSVSVLLEGNIAQPMCSLRSLRRPLQSFEFVILLKGIQWVLPVRCCLFCESSLVLPESKNGCEQVWAPPWEEKKGCSQNLWWMRAPLAL